MLDGVTIEGLNQQFPEYSIEHHINTGGQKAVFKGQYDGDDIVFKILPIESDSGEERGDREVEAMERIDHPVLVNLKEGFKDEVNGFRALIFVEEFVEGRTLRSNIDSRSGGMDLGLTLLDSLLDILCEFEKEDIVHRDIKPSNIIITPNGEVRLLDVGVARMLTKTSLTPTIAPHGPGTMPYAPPEVLENEKSLQDVRTDMFSTGIVTFETITYRHPFDVDGLGIPGAILQDNKRDLLGHGESSEFEIKLNDIYHQLTKSEPYQRYRKPEFAQDDLEEAMEVRQNV